MTVLVSDLAADHVTLGWMVFMGRYNTTDTTTKYRRPERAYKSTDERTRPVPVDIVSIVPVVKVVM